ncbi:MAG: primosomal protein DnaI [Bacilli bacterium]|jgi:primosomal protein DnaI|nr:primosomal protein DnaI [Bacilli bacterium]
MKTVTEIVQEKFSYKKVVLLKDSYLQALKKAEFRKLISTLNLPEEDLIKYTSKLEECAFEINNCQKCQNLLSCPNNMMGFVFTPINDDNRLIFSYVACRYQQKITKDRAYQDNVYAVDVPKEIRIACMRKIDTTDKNRYEVITWLKKFIERYLKSSSIKGLYLSGNFGSGKTYLVAAMFNELAKKNIRSAIIYWPEYLRKLKASFNDDFANNFESIKKIPLLLIDDIGAENTTAWSRDEILGSILQYRMQEYLPTFFTSNLNLDELRDHFSITSNSVDLVKATRIIERIKQLTTVKQMISANRRK